MKNDFERRENCPAQSYAQACASPALENANGTEALGAAEKRDYSEKYAQNDDPLGAPMTIREVAVLLGCSRWTVRQRHMRRGLPFHRIGTRGKLLFYRKQVVQWILQNQK
jgi:excisionase family DNA binding protein